MLPAVVGCGFLSREACTVVAVGDFAGGDGGLWDYGGELDGAGKLSDGGNPEGSFWWMDSGRRWLLVVCIVWTYSANPCCSIYIVEAIA